MLLDNAFKNHGDRQVDFTYYGWYTVIEVKKMARKAREKSSSGIYHIMIRGINRQDLFEDDEDRQRFIATLALYKEKSEYRIFGYCLMSNHVHLILKEEKEPISIVMKRISSSYVFYYNSKYDRCGHLFQERFKSEAIENDSYFLTVLRYVHQNPVKANMVKNLKEYKWSSYNEYVNISKITDTDFALKMFSEDKAYAINRFISFNNEQNDDKCLEYMENKRINDTEAREIIEDIVKIKNISAIQSFEKEKRDEVIKKIKEVEGMSIRQIARITGLSYNTVLKL